MRRHGLAGRTLTLKVRFSDFHTITRSSTFAGATDSTSAITRGAKELLAAVDPSPGVRLIGVSMSGLSDGAARQLTLDDVGSPGWDDATQAVDAIRERFGTASIGPATLADRGGLRVRREAEAPWGPGDRTTRTGSRWALLVTEKGGGDQRPRVVDAGLLWKDERRDLPNRRPAGRSTGRIQPTKG